MTQKQKNGVLKNAQSETILIYPHKMAANRKYPYTLQITIYS